MTVLVGKFTSQAAFVVWLAFVGNAVCQNLDCPDGITNIQAASGSIAYPGSSSTYGENQTKCWRIVVPDTEIYSGIGIYYNMFDVEQCDFCACDSLTLVDYRYGRWRVSKKCGRQTSLYLDFLQFVDGDPDNSYSSNELYLQFSSDDSVNLKGFNLSFIAKISSTCPHGITNITGKISGEIVYPSSGMYGPNEIKCWRIEVPKPYNGIGIKFHRFDVEECPNCECDSFSIGGMFFNFLRMKSGTCRRYSPDYSNYRRRVLGTSPEWKRIGQNVYLRFKTDDSIHFNGINISFTVESRRSDFAKETFLNVSSGEVSTPKFGLKNYPANFNWEWFLLATEGHQIKIKFESFELEQSEHCQNDYLEIREAYFQDPNYPMEIRGVFGAVLARPMCGNNLPREIHSAGNMVWVHFRSDSNPTTTYKGFKAIFMSSKINGAGIMGSSAAPVEETWFPSKEIIITGKV
ncbi:tolloid-like protein 2 [Acropora palmata]|uniref:tolloid-like protein 2 n=1 Tax=Acropora palmata TaxID=6131 RepID=UPI003DA03CA6